MYDFHAYVLSGQSWTVVEAASILNGEGRYVGIGLSEMAGAVGMRYRLHNRIFAKRAPKTRSITGRVCPGAAPRSASTLPGTGQSYTWPIPVIEATLLELFQYPKLGLSSGRGACPGLSEAVNY
jgi:hypothetical protein